MKVKPFVYVLLVPAILVGIFILRGGADYLRQFIDRFQYSKNLKTDENHSSYNSNSRKIESSLPVPPNGSKEHVSRKLDDPKYEAGTLKLMSFQLCIDDAIICF